MANLNDTFKKIQSNNNLLSIKAEFEAEGNSLEELTLLSNQCNFYKIPLTLKIGGPQAKRDIFEAIQIGAEKILAPMVESKSALVEFLEIFNESYEIFKDYSPPPLIAINIESSLAIKNINEIIDYISNYKFQKISIVIGRSDLSASYNNNDVNSHEIYELCKLILITKKSM